MEQQLKNVRELGLLPLNSKSKYEDVNIIIKEVNCYMYKYAFCFVSSGFAYYTTQYLKLILDSLRELWKADTDLTKRQTIEEVARLLNAYIGILEPIIGEEPDWHTEVQVKKFFLTKWLKQRDEWEENHHNPTLSELEEWMRSELVIEKCYSQTSQGSRYKSLRRAMQEQKDMMLRIINEISNADETLIRVIR